jgi:hypothetical protein
VRDRAITAETSVTKLLAGNLGTQGFEDWTTQGGTTPMKITVL